MVSAAIPVDIVLVVVELSGTCSGIIWAVFQPTKEAKIENLTNKFGLVWIGRIILIKISIALKGTISLSPHCSLLDVLHFSF